MATLALVTVKSWNSLTLNRQELISLDHVRGYQPSASGADCLVKYNPFNANYPDNIVLDDTYASFDTVYKGKEASAGVPMYFVSQNDLNIGEERVVDSKDILQIVAIDSVNCRLMYFEQDSVPKAAVVRGTLLTILASAYAVLGNLIQDFEIENVSATLTTPVALPAEMADDDYDIYFSDINGVGIDVEATYATRTTTGFDLITLAGSGTESVGCLVVAKTA